MDKFACISVLAICLCFAVVSAIDEVKDLSNGWHDDIAWWSFDTAVEESKRTGRPIMLIIHKTWCGACKALKPKFAESKQIAELSSNFIMVNTVDDDEPKDKQYSPDGGYIPRILFIKDGEVKEDLFHENGNAKYKYYYHSPGGIIATMERAKERLLSSSHSTDEL